MRHPHGFSLIEFMVVIGILALLLGLLIPNYIHYRSNQNMRSTVDTLVAEARLARQTARENGDGVVFTGALAINQPPDGATQVTVFRVAGGQVDSQIGQTLIDGEFTPGGKNLLTEAQLKTAAVPLGALVAFTGPHAPTQVLAFKQSGVPLIQAPAPQTSGAVSLTNKSMTIQMLISATGDVREVQSGDTSVPPNEQLVLNALSLPF